MFDLDLVTCDDNGDDYDKIIIVVVCVQGHLLSLFCEGVVTPRNSLCK